MNADVLLVHFHEIALKGRNRGDFVAALRRNLQAALGEHATGVVSHGDRLEVLGPGDAALERVQRVFGVANFAPARAVAARPDEVVAAAVDVARDRDADEPFSTFAVRARRARTGFPRTSQELNETIGERIRLGLGKRVDLSEPDVTIRVEVVEDRAFVSARQLTGPGGLPVGTAGRVVGLLSGGIDSPVAMWRILKRGADVIPVHCHGQPFTDPSSERNVERLVEQLGSWGLGGTWWSVPIGEAQREVTLHAPPRLRVLLYRRLMLRVASLIAEREGAGALVTGESLSQVASQTLENMAAVDAATTRLVLRPLVGMDKLEIIGQAQAIGTYDTSVRPHQDCCSLFEPREVATRSSAVALDEAEAAVAVEDAARACVEAGTHRTGPRPSASPVGTITS